MRALIDDALVALTRAQVSSIELENVESLLESSLGSAYAALATGADFAAFKRHAEEVKTGCQNTLATLQAVPSEDPAINASLRFVAFAFGIVQRLSFMGSEDVDLPRPEGDTTIALASFDEPRFIDARGTLLRPRLPLPIVEKPEEEVEPIVEPAPFSTLEELEAAMEKTAEELRAFDAPEEDGADDEPRELTPPLSDEQAIVERFGVAVTVEDQLVDQSRSLLLDLANMGRMRRPTPDESWCSGEMTEHRLVRRVDALVACGEAVFPELVDMLADQPLPDPEMTWALIFLFGSIRGDDMFDQAWRIARSVDFSESDFGRDFVEAVSDAFTFAPHPRINHALSNWFEDADPARREVAVRALARRKALTTQQIENALSDESRLVQIAGAEAVASSDAATPSLLNRATLSDDEELAHAALWGSSQRKSGAGLRRARELVAEGRPEFAQAARLLAIAGGEAGRNMLLQVFGSSPTPAIILAMGWLGDAQALEGLFSLFQKGSVDQQIAALEAIERITGASLTEDAPEGTERDVPLFGVGFCEYEPPMDLIDDVEPWLDWYSKHRREAKPNRRYRFGHVFTYRDLLWELEAEDFTNPQREVTYTELVAWTGGTLPLDRRDFLVRQRRQLEQWRRYLGAKLEHSPQGWRTTLEN